MNKSQIKKQAKSLKRELRNIYNRLDNLMDDAENTAEGMTENQIRDGKADELNKIAGILQSARDNALNAVEDIECMNV